MILFAFDSLIKKFEGDFTKFLSQHIYYLFSTAYTEAEPDMEAKIKLFKLFYAWKYYINHNILTALKRDLSLNNMESYLRNTKPDLMFRYDNYNEAERIKRENLTKQFTTTSNETSINNKNNIQKSISAPSIVPDDTTLKASNTKSFNNQKLIENKPILNNNSVNTRTEAKLGTSVLLGKNNMKKSLLSEIHVHTDPHKNKRNVRKGSRDNSDLFSSDSSPMISNDFSDNEIDNKQRNNKLQYNKDKLTDHDKMFIQSKDIPIKRIYNKDENFNNSIEKITKSKTSNFLTSDNISEDKNINLVSNNTDSNNKQGFGINNEIKNILPVNLIGKPLNPNESFQQFIEFVKNNPNINPNNIEQLKQFMNMNAMNAYLKQSQGQGATGKLPLVPVIPRPFINQVNLPFNLNSNNILPTTNPIIPIITPNTIPDLNKEISNITNNLTQHTQQSTIEFFTLSSNQQLDDQLPLFGAISKWFNDTLRDYNPIKDLIKENSKDIKSRLDVLKIKDFTSNKNYKELKDNVINSLYKQQASSCPMCGYRTKHYDKYVEHLDIHFHINYIKRNSQKKVLYRNESINKQDWLQTTNSTLNSVLYYQNEPDLLLNNHLNNSKQNFMEENSTSIFPIQKQDVNCVYCGDEFKKKFLNKYHYWFYINVLKFQIEEYKDLRQILNLEEEHYKEDYFLIHDSCNEDFMTLVTQKESIIKLLGNKRNFMEN